MDRHTQTALVVAALAACPEIPASPPSPSEEEVIDDPPPYDSAPGLRRTPRGDRHPPPRLGDPVLVRWPDGREDSLPLRTALARARALHRPATLSAPGLSGEIRADGSWAIRREISR